ncbi:hypothetical protein OIU76_009705 [Salix suchowensis]|nr:hypothetical protein OIU76_009705 [Salix suchowensis]
MASNPFWSCPIDTGFDLDEALTLPGNLSQQITDSNSTIVADMPTFAWRGVSDQLKKSRAGMSTINLASPPGSPTPTLVLSAAVTSPASYYASYKRICNSVLS